MKNYVASILLLPFAATAADTDALPALTPAYGELPPTFGELHQSTIIVGGFAFLAVAFLFLRIWLRPKTPVILPPEVLARRSLAKLQSQPEDGKALSEASQILRHYVSETFGLPNHELTTAEFCAATETSPQIGAELAGTISSFLRECDVRKFSPVKSTAPLNAAARALELVALTENATHRPAACATENDRRI
jgi:hypothetical protein